MANKIERYFGKCATKGCKTRRVLAAPYLADGTLVFYNGGNGAALAAAGVWCADHNRPLTFTQLIGRVNADKECNGVCMAAVGPSCDCSCGGENHGRGHL